MHILVDGQALVGSIPTGFGIYTRLLTQALQKLSEEKKISHKLFTPEPKEKALRSVAERLLWERVKLPIRINSYTAKREASLFHSPCLGAPHPINIPLLVTIHDLILLKSPPLGIFAKYYFQNIVVAGWRRAKLIVCHSETIKQEVIQFLRIPEERVYVVPLYSRFESKNTKRKLTIEKPHSAPFTLLLVGSFEKRKNFEIVLHSISLLPNDLRKDCVIEYAGISINNGQEILEVAKSLNLQNQVHLLGYLSEDALLEAYLRAFVLIAPSKEEGFDLPPLEAMSLGVPSILSNINVHKEIYGTNQVFNGNAKFSSVNLKIPLAKYENFSIFFDPNSPEELAGIISKLILDKDFYESLHKRALILSKLYTSELFKENMLRAYKKCVQKS